MRNVGSKIIVLLCALAVLAATAASAGAAPRQTRAQYWVEGRGWGHGIGMSQYGANGYANRGWSSDRIIRHYYTGTVIAPRPTSGPKNLRVLLQSFLAPARIQMTSGGVVRQGSSSLALAKGDIVEMRSVGARLVVTRVRAGSANAVVPGPATGDATITPAVDGGVRALFASDHAGFGSTFRGTLTGHRYEGGVSIVNTLPFESYLRGVVPDEMPPSWHREALEAQAIAARSYALRGLRTDFNWFDVYSDTRSQVYGGIGSEEPSTDAAIAATANLVARVGSATGEVAQTFFFSTSGGRTAGNDEVWGSSPVSYLRSVASPYEAASPYFLWRGEDVLRFTPARLGRELGFGRGFRSASSTVYRSGYAKDVVVRTASGVRTRSASSVQASMGLRSTFFRISYLSVNAPRSAAGGSYVKFTGRAPRGGATHLLLRRNGMTRSIRLRPVGKLGAWTVRTRMSGHVLATLSRARLTGPRVFVRSVG